MSKSLFNSIFRSISCLLVGGAFVALLLAALVGPPVLAESEYAPPSFDPEHSGSYTMPNESIDTFTGGLNLVEKDIVLPGPNGFDLEVIRWYSSKITQRDANCLATEPREITPVGVGWQMHMGRLWDNPGQFDPVPAFKLELPGGQQQPFYSNDRLHVPNADFISPGGWSLRTESCVGAAGNCKIATSPAGIEYHFPTGTNYRMDPDNSYLYVATILDPVGNEISVEYDFACNCNQAYILSVTDTWGRKVHFHYTEGEEEEKACSLDGSWCAFDGDCPDRCSGAGSEPCTFDHECGEGACSDDGSSCTSATECDRNCSNDPSVTCTADIHCGDSHCVGGSENGQPCSFDSQCDNVCEGGEHPGDPCNYDSQCGATCEAGEYPGDPCTRDSQCGGLCKGGAYPGDSCVSDNTCGALCKGGESPGDPCSDDYQCGAICEGGFYPGDPCNDDSQCGSVCGGGPDSGDSCTGDFQCRNVCSNDTMKACNYDYQCPGGTCVIGTCEPGTCKHGTCDVGACELGVCIDGTCNVGTCPPGPTCEPQPSCDNPGECLDNQCQAGETGQRFLDKITVAWLSGTATYEYTIDEGSEIDPVLASFSTPAGLTWSYDHSPGTGELRARARITSHF